MFSKVYIGYSEVAMGKNEENWFTKYTALREHVEAHGHLTSAHSAQPLVEIPEEETEGR